MELTKTLLNELQKRLKIGNRRGVHLNAIPANSRYKFDLNRLAHIDKNIPKNFINALLTDQPLKFRISWKENVPDLNSLIEEDLSHLVKITKSLENLINQTEAIETEKGINTFGFGFPILIRRDKSDGKLTVAPILIWSLRIKRTKEFNTWEIQRNDNDPIYVNEVLINHLENDSNIKIEQIPSEMLDDGLINKEELLQICGNLIKTINYTIPNDLEESLKSKLNNVVSIGDKNHYEKLPVNATNAFIDFGGLFSIFEVQKQNIINEYDTLMELEGLKINLDDLEVHDFQSISSIETDPSQQGILHSLEVKRNILIQGPPGTGKSQTLTAILVNALENKQKTIVVCEKITALEVLQKALIEKGLGQHSVLIRDIVKDRKIVVDSVRDRVTIAENLNRQITHLKDSLDSTISKIKELITSINNKHKKLDSKILGGNNWTDIVGEFLRELKCNNENENENLNFDKSKFFYSTQELNSYVELIQKGQHLYNEYHTMNSKSFLNSCKLVGDNPFSIEQLLMEDFFQYSKQLEQIKGLFEINRNEYITLRKSELKNQIIEINECVENIIKKEKEFDVLIKKTKADFENFRNSELESQTEKAYQFLNKIDLILSCYENNPDITDVKKINSLGYKIASFFVKSKKQTIVDCIALHNNSLQLEECLRISKDYKHITLKKELEFINESLILLKHEILEVKSGFEQKIANEFNYFKLYSLLCDNNNQDPFNAIQIEINDNNNSESFRAKLISIQSTFEEYLSEIQFAFLDLSGKLGESKDIEIDFIVEKAFEKNKETMLALKDKIEYIKMNFDSKVLNEFKNLNLLKSDSNELKIKSLQTLQEKTFALGNKLNTDNWTIEDIKYSDLRNFIFNIEALIQKKNEYFDSEQDLFTIEFSWFQFYNELSDDNKLILNELKSKSDWKKSFLIFYLNSLLLNQADIDLPTEDFKHKQLVIKLKEVERLQLKYINEYWTSQKIETSHDFKQKNANLKIDNLYNYKSGNKFKRLSLRQIVKFDTDLFTTYFPIILTSPDVCCNLFKDMNGYFDIVMFDEASQLRIEDNLPAILKGKQIVIAGDEHQMPPSNYFSKVFDGSIEDEDELEEENEIVIDRNNILLSCESLLEFASELNFERRHLDFHYRSRHPYLIDFSNFAFYKQRLKPLPNNFDYVPIKYIPVNGTFSDYSNEAEAEMVISIIENNINRLPNGEYPTIGVATFNIHQRNLIKSKIIERQKFSKYEEFNNKIQELEEHGMFIKNLENIQGDEKDVIILSTTYGIGKDGKFGQRFGPINHAKGYKLLNVIITRAKYKVYVCSSIPEQYFMNYKDLLLTEGANNRRAVFYAYLAYSKAVSENNKEAKDSVLSALSLNTPQNTIISGERYGQTESPFEEEVYQTLVEEFGEENLIPQFQFAGFRIDIVFDYFNKNVPKIAIECDGANYHSSKEAYLYDLHRQKILENHGFVFHRIWSTNWWRNPKRETHRLIEFIKSVKSASNFQMKDYSQTSKAFNDDIKIVESYAELLTQLEIDTELSSIQTIEKQVKESTDLCENVRLYSLVNITYMNSGKDIIVNIVDNAKKNEIENGIQKINSNSPLAVSIIGHKVGDIVKVGNLDNFVEIKEIHNN